MDRNRCCICGVISEIRESHEYMGRKYYHAIASVSRKSETIDQIPLLISGNILYNAGLQDGDRVFIRGRLRSRICMVKEQRHRDLYVYVHDIREGEQDEEDRNEAVLEGALWKKPICRQTPLGRKICDLMVCVRRTDSRHDRIPCIAWGKQTQTIETGSVNDRVFLTGRIQSRNYMKDNIIHTVHEISVSEISIAKYTDTESGEPSAV